MSSVKGRYIQFSMFGESHGPAFGMTIHSFPAGVTIDDQGIALALDKRRTGGLYASQRIEGDRVEWLSGTLNGKTTGAPLTFIIRNENQHSRDYDQLARVVRPSHADYPAFVKYQGFNDPRGGGIFSGRLTAAYVVAGTLCKQLLMASEITIEAQITQLGRLSLPFGAAMDSQAPWLQALKPEWRELVNTILQEVQSEGDSVGGTVSVKVNGLPAGVGDPHFHSVESELASWLWSIPGLKAISFGLGHEFAKSKGSIVNDSAYMDKGTVKHKSNHNGGVFGGISNGMPLELAVTFKPTPSIYMKQNTVDVHTMTDTNLEITGRHDPAFVIRTPVVVESVIAMALLDLIQGVRT